MQMEELAQNLLALIKKSSASTETKITQFNNVKSHIKHERVPDNAQAPILECIRLAIVSQTSSSLVTTGFSTLGHLVKRLSLQDQLAVVVSQRSQIIPALIERLGDSKETYRTAALYALEEVWPAKPLEVEKAVRESAIQGSSVRAKEAGMQWVSKMHTEKDLQFKGFVAPLVECLDHADGTVRETAKATLVDLFKTAPDRAKADLKRQLVAHNIRKSIATHILSQLHISLPSELSSSSTTSAPARAATPHQDVGLADNQGDISLPPSAETTHIEPMDVYGHRELEDMLRGMQPCFVGKENEDNWKARDNNVLKLRRLIKGNAPDDHHVIFLAGIKSLLEGILKVANTLRTTMSTNGCQLVQELIRKLSTSMDSMVEILVQNFVKMCSNTKNISAQNGNTTVDVIFSHVTYNTRLLQHTWSACQDKNVQPRIFAAGWLRTLLRRQVHSKGHFDHSGGLETAENCMKKGLTDANPKVRESMRKTYWTFAQGWPEKAEAIVNAMDAKTKTQLEKDPANPNSGNAQSSFTSSVGPNAASNPRAAVSNQRATLKEAIAAQKKAVKKMPDRPNSAMATLSPMKQGGASASRNRTPSHSSTSASRVPPNQTSQASARPFNAGSSSTGQGSLMSAPVRRPRRPEGPRPATADPYANRNMMQADTPPNNSPNASPVKTASRQTTSNHVKAKSTTTIRPTTAGSDKSSTVGSPRTSPAKVRGKNNQPPDSPSGRRKKEPVDGSTLSPTSTEDNFTMVVPSAKSSGRTQLHSSRSRQDLTRPGSGHSPLPSTAEEDNFTLIIPSKAHEMNSSAGSGSSRKTPQSLQPSVFAFESSAAHNEDQQTHDELLDSPTFTAEKPVPIYEDPEADQSGQSSRAEPVETILEELPVNEQNNILPVRGTSADIAEEHTDEEDHPVSPSKYGFDRGGDMSQDRAETLKNRRLLASGIDRIRTKTLDPHGFRRLQEFVKSSAKETNAPLGELLEALCGYVESPDQALRVSASKAQSLKSQCLATIRGLIALHRQDDKVRALVGKALCAVLATCRSTENGSRVANDVDKTVSQLLRTSGDQTRDCIDSVLLFTENEATSESSSHGRVASASLGVLSRLLQQAKSRQEGTDAVQRQRMGKVAVRFLDDIDADVRRADTEFCTDLYGVFSDDNKEQFWDVLKGAREAQLNLVAYYLARRNRAAA
ncbi:MAG: suppressor of tub2 mutation [Chrysothrix sp. TS-e1954]|nr:MAG: suppressor of tub2 mutation [Chrysothrix sp. TS-e1954]